jgi:hypothetical protein
MGLVSWTLGLPLQPVRAVVALGRVVQREVEREQYSAPSIRRGLEEIEQERARDPEHYSEEREERELRRITEARIPPAQPHGGER